MLELRIKLNLISMNGVMVDSRSTKATRGINRVNLQVNANWSAGMYIVELRNESGTLRRREKIIVE